MDLLQILTSSENLYKYLLIGGLGLIVISVFYPIERKYELKNKVDLVNKDIATINYKIDELKKDVQSFYLQYGTDSAINAAKRSKSKLAIARDQFDDAYDSFKNKRTQIDYAQIEINYGKAQASTISQQIAEFRNYQIYFIIFGIVFSVAGIIGWFFLMTRGQKKQEESAEE